MEQVQWELSILCKAVAFENLSLAASNIHLSQPQLSRIVKRIEEELSLTLLDRKSKRNSSWTLVARRLAALVEKHNRILKQDLQGLSAHSQVTRLNVATLEGLTPLA